MKDENLIHIKFEQGEALNSKKDLLFAQAEMLRTMRSMKRYQLFRADELTLKLELYKKIKLVLKNIKKIEAELPKMKIPAILKHHKEKQAPIIKAVIKPKQIHPNDIEAQLKEIQDKLKELG